MRRTTIASALSVATALACTLTLSTTSVADQAAGGTQKADPGKVVFSDDFEDGNLDKWDVQACDDGVTIADSPARSGAHSAKFLVHDDSTSDNCDRVPTHNPRAQIVSDPLFDEGSEYYIGLSIYFPKDFPTPPDWFQLAELYGEPFGGSPSMGLDMCGQKMCFRRDEQHGYDSIWDMDRDVTKGGWEDIVLHVKFSTDADTGFVEIWNNGVQQTMANGQKRENYQTLVPGVNWDGTPNSLFLNQYRSSEGMGDVTLYQDDVKVGTTYDSVAR